MPQMDGQQGQLENHQMSHHRRARVIRSHNIRSNIPSLGIHIPVEPALVMWDTQQHDSPIPDPYGAELHR